MTEGMFHIPDVERPKKTGSVETRLKAMEQQVFKCQGMVERGLNANHMMITEFTSNNKMDAIDIGKHLSRLYDRVDQLQGQIYDLQNQNSPKDKIFEKVINPCLTGVLQHPQSIEMHEGMLHIRDVEGPKKTGSVETRLEAMEQQVFKCQGMVKRGLDANHMMITEFTNKHRIDANDIGKHLSRLYDRIDQLQAQIYDLQNQNSEYEYRFKSIRSSHYVTTTRRQIGHLFLAASVDSDVAHPVVAWVEKYPTSRTLKC
ncbi:40S ribosomal protein S5-1 [Hordeum vulgare]|nr:40S ribosomal protein S5-1 [Hordeum vulgare]